MYSPCMASLAACRLPTLMSSVYSRVRSSTCSFDFERRESDSRKINGAPPEDLEKRKSHRLMHVPPGYVIPAPCVSETKCLGYDVIQYASAAEEEATATHTPLSPKPNPNPNPNPKHDHSFVRYYTSQNLSANVNPDIFIHSKDKDNHAYFTAYSLDEEDGSMSPKYYIYPPSFIKEKCIFLGATCNGLFHFVDTDCEHLLWNPTTDELKTLPNSFVQRPLHHSLQVACKMWSSDHRRRQTYKLLQLVMTYKLDEEGEYTDDECCYYIWLYSLKTNSWKEIPCTQISLISQPTSACINGVFYSPAFLKEPEPEGAEAILSFDFSSETVSSVPLPLTESELRKLCYRILEYKGLLSIVVYSCHGIPTEYELWVRNIKKDGRFVWTRESVFHVSGVQYPVWFSKSGQLLYFESFDYEVVVFDRALGKSKNLGIYTHSKPLNFYPFVETVVQLNDDEEEEEDDDGYTTEAEDGPLMQA